MRLRRRRREPIEAFELACRMRAVRGDGGKARLSHSFARPEGEVQSRLSLERYSCGDKSGYALALQRGAEEVNVPRA